MRLRVAAVVAAAAIGIAIAIAWGFKALVVYAVLVLGTTLAVAALAAGGTWVQDISRRRFDDRR